MRALVLVHQHALVAGAAATTHINEQGIRGRQESEITIQNYKANGFYFFKIPVAIAKPNVTSWLLGVHSEKVLRTAAPVLKCPHHRLLF